MQQWKSSICPAPNRCMPVQRCGVFPPFSPMSVPCISLKCGHIPRRIFGVFLYMGSCTESSVSTDFCIFCKNLILSRSMLPCSALHASLKTEGSGQSHPFAPWSKCKKRNRREHLRLRFDPFSKLRHQSTPYCCLNSADVLLLRHRAAGRSQTRCREYH